MAADDGSGGSPAVAVEPSSPPRLVNVHKQGGDLSTPTKPHHDDSEEEERHTPMTSPTSSANTNTDANTISSTSTTSRAAADNLTLATENAEEGGVRAMDVAVTVLSMHGIVAKNKKGSSGITTKQKRKANRMHSNSTATIVASFSQTISKDRVFLTHVPSTPVSLDSTAAGSGGSLAGRAPSNASTISSNASISSGSSGPTGHAGSGHADGSNVMQPVVHWPSMVDVDEMEDNKVTAASALSTLQFQRKFVREGRGRFVPQTCPVNLSISRNGKMALLGKANLIINGEESGETSMTVPITSSVRVNKSAAGAAGRGVKKIRNMGKSKKGSEASIAMVKVSKGDTFQFGLEGDAMLRVLIHVSDPSAVDKKETKDDKSAAAAASADEMEAMSRVSVGHDVAEDTLASIGEIEHEDDDDDHSREGLSVEGMDMNDSDSLEQDDYYARMQRHMMENNEVRSLRQKLANSEHTNKVLQMELANARQEATIALDNEREYEEENDRLREELEEARRETVAALGDEGCLREENRQLKADLEQARANAETLKQDLHTAKNEGEMLPIYETRVSELLEELKKRDLEVQCLHDEIGELRGHYKDHLADSLLWEKEDGNKGDTTERKAVLAEALRKITAFRKEEEKSPEDLLWDTDDEEVVPSSDKAEEGEDEVATSADDIEDGEKAEDVPSDVSTDISQETPSIVDNFASILKGVSPIKEEDAEEEEELEEMPETLSDEEAGGQPKDGGEENDKSETTSEVSSEVTGETLPRKSWGVRRLGAGILSLEEKMRIRQQQFREQQQKLEEQKLAQQQTQPQEPGLGGVLISRISSHGSTGRQTSMENAEKSMEEKEEIEEPESASSTVDNDGSGVNKSVEESAAEGASNKDGSDCTETDSPSSNDSPNDESEPKEEDEMIFRKSSYNQVLLQESIDELEKAVFLDPSSCSTAAPSPAEDDKGSSHAGIMSRISSCSSVEDDTEERDAPQKDSNDGNGPKSATSQGVDGMSSCDGDINGQKNKESEVVVASNETDEVTLQKGAVEEASTLNNTSEELEVSALGSSEDAPTVASFGDERSETVVDAAQKTEGGESTASHEAISNESEKNDSLLNADGESEGSANGEPAISTESETRGTNSVKESIEGTLEEKKEEPAPVDIANASSPSAGRPFKDGTNEDQTVEETGSQSDTEEADDSSSDEEFKQFVRVCSSDALDGPNESHVGTVIVEE